MGFFPYNTEIRQFTECNIPLIALFEQTAKYLTRQYIIPLICYDMLHYLNPVMSNHKNHDYNKEVAMSESFLYKSQSFCIM